MSDDLTNVSTPAGRSGKRTLWWIAGIVVVLAVLAAGAIRIGAIGASFAAEYPRATIIAIVLFGLLAVILGVLAVTICLSLALRPAAPAAAA